jgi:hypothetical protein
MTPKLWPLLALILLLTGCMPVDSLNPLYTDKDVVFDDALDGDWVTLDSENKSVTSFVRTSSNTEPDYYTLKMVDDEGSKTEFQAHLLEIGGYRFLDTIPEVWEARSDSYSLHLISTKHGIKVQPRLLRLGMAAYLEFTPAPENGGEIQARLRRAHSFFRVRLDHNSMRLDWIDDEVLRKSIEQGKIHIGNVIMGEGKSKNLVLTAETKDLQRFVIDHIDDDSVFSEHSDEMQRRP